MRINSEADIQALGKVSGSVKKQLLNALNTPDYSRQTNKSSERLKREARKDFVLLPEYDRDPDPENVLVRESITTILYWLWDLLLTNSVGPAKI